MTEDQRVMYEGLVSTRNNEITLRWTRTQLFFFVHSAGLSFVTTQFKIGTVVHIAACVVGIYLAYLWLRTTQRMRGWLEFWTSRLTALERGDPQPIQVYGGPEFDREYSGVLIHDLLINMVRVFVVVWTTLFLSSVGGVLLNLIKEV